MLGKRTALKNPPIFANPEATPTSFTSNDLRTTANVKALAPFPYPITIKRIVRINKGGFPPNKRKVAQLKKRMIWTKI
jgi:hypothetical protein